MKRKVYPECDKMVAVNKESQAIGNFLSWLGENGMFVAEYVEFERGQEGRAFPITKSIEQILADYFEIDLKKVEKERRQILADFQRSSTEETQ